jgi:hypothetical protein
MWSEDIYDVVVGEETDEAMKHKECAHAVVPNGLDYG